MSEADGPTADGRTDRKQLLLQSLTLLSRAESNNVHSKHHVRIRRSIERERKRPWRSKTTFTFPRKRLRSFVYRGLNLVGTVRQRKRRWSSSLPSLVLSLRAGENECRSSEWSVGRVASRKEAREKEASIEEQLSLSKKAVQKKNTFSLEPTSTTFNLFCVSPGKRRDG